MTRPVPVFRPVFSRLQRGAAIVTALLVVALATVIAILLSLAFRLIAPSAEERKE